MDRTVISWTFENWLTVVLMVMLGGLVYGVMARSAFALASRDA